MSRHPTATAGTVRVFNAVLKRGVRVPAYWRGKHFAVTKGLSSKPTAPHFYAVTHLPTGCAAHYKTVLRRAIRFARVLDAQDPGVWGSPRWRFGDVAIIGDALHDTAYGLLAAAKRDARERENVRALLATAKRDAEEGRKR